MLVEEGMPPVPGAAIIAEYLDETARRRKFRQLRLMPRETAARVEVRRLMSWFNDKFFEEASGPLVMERVYKRYIPAGRAAARPIPKRCGRRAATLSTIWAISAGSFARRDWLAGDRLTYADLSAAAHLSAVDYLGDVPWNEDETAKAWYARIKSRPSFRTLLGETLPGLAPSPSYANLDF